MVGTDIQLNSSILKSKIPLRVQLSFAFFLPCMTNTTDTKSSVTSKNRQMSIKVAQK